MIKKLPQTLITALKTAAQPNAWRRVARAESARPGLDRESLGRIACRTDRSALTSLLGRQIADAQHRLAAICGDEERRQQIRLIDDLLRRQAREIETTRILA